MYRFAVPLLAAVAGYSLARAASGSRISPTPPPAATAVAAATPEWTPPLTSQAARASHALAAIDALQPADFDAFTRDPATLARIIEREASLELFGPFADALTERWLQMDSAGGFTAIRQAINALGEMKVFGMRVAETFKAQLIEKRPLETIAALPAKLNDDQMWREFNPALCEIAKRDVRQARAIFDQITDPTQRQRAQYALVNGIATHDPVAAVALARDFKNDYAMAEVLAGAASHGRGTVRQVIAAMNGFQVEGNFTELVLRYPDEDWRSVLKDSAYASGVSFPRLVEALRVPPAERRRRLEASSEIPGASGDSTQQALLTVWAKENPAEAMQWIADKTEDTRPLVRHVFDLWTESDFDAARAWCEQLPASPRREDLRNRIATRLAQRGDADAALKLLTVSGRDDAREAINAIIWPMRERDPAGAAQWLVSLPSETEPDNRLFWTVRAWLKREPEKAARWAESLPPGPMRDTAVRGVGEEVRTADPKLAGEWIAQMSESKAKTAAAQYVYRELAMRNPAAAREWLRAQAGLDPLWARFQLKLGHW